MALSIPERLVGRVPWTLLVCVLFIALLGVYNLASASRPPAASAWITQLVYIGIGFVVAAAVSITNYRVIQKATLLIYFINLAALVALQFFGHKAKGAASWFVVGPLRIQPAEFMKISMVLLLAQYFHRNARSRYGFQQLALPAAIALVPIFLVLAQPDLGTALMMTFTAATIVLFAYPRWSVLVVLGIVVLAGVGILWNDYLRVQPNQRFTILRHQLKQHQNNRITSWLEPTSDLKGSNYHAMQSKIAVGSGGTYGKGWRQGTQTGLRYLPEQHTDFIFSVFAEEQGFVACLILLALYGMVLLAALGVATTACERFGTFLAVGIAAMLFWQVFENIGMVTGLLPITGITLPLMSYGGSSIVSVMCGIGLLVAVNRHRQLFTS